MNEHIFPPLLIICCQWPLCIKYLGLEFFNLHFSNTFCFQDGFAPPDEIEDGYEMPPEGDPEEF